MKHKVIFIPPSYFYLSMIIILATRFLLPRFNFIIYPYNLLGVFLFLLGFYIMMWVWKVFKRYNTPENFDRSNKLVTQGLFKFSRNPMYLGMLLMLFGISIFSSNSISFLGQFCFF